MVSALWKACSAGELEAVQDLLKEATNVDIEVKDHTGVTPLIEAVRNGHLEVARALLGKGADPTNSSSQGPPAQYTSEPAILELLSFFQNKAADGPVYSQDSNENIEKQFQYGPSAPAAYTYYPSIHSAPPPPSEGGVYYPQPPPQNAGESHVPGGVGNLPPPEVARFIPCRYFPACRYGASCLFAHPQQYYPGSLAPPPAQYVAPYDSMNVQPYPSNYFPPPSFQPPNGAHPMTPMSPPSGPHPGHGHSPSEVILPLQPPFNPNGIPPVPYGPMSPNAYSHPGQVSVPMIMPPLQHQTALPNQTPSNMYNNAPASAPSYVQHDGTTPYPVSQPGKPSVTPQELNGDVKLPHLQDTSGTNHHHPMPREGAGHHRRGGRRGSFNGRKPPCLFFPTGRCKNGDDCRFPHVLPDANGTHHIPYFSGRGGPRPRHPNGNGIAAINEKLSGMSIRDDAPARQNGTEGSSRSQSTDPGRPRFHQGGKNGYAPNATRPDKRPPPPKQRVPNADEFPVLAGFITPPTRNPGLNGILPNGNGHAGPTAAQVLQAPPPPRKDSSKESSTRGTTPDPIKSTAAKAEPNGVAPETAPTTTHDHPTVKLPVSFAAVAAPEMPKEITLSA
ncbi:hypothetical protein D9615_001348 [Tricholomella constricta]|uniref:C3H1-type domain-containing protein n=1 Tax=Tricholomella constricta TaxID=117010 RepID=A0A8H5M908_9AGAR|nr:hypothetical protein D9615_001348 [Tricholomella constricta]